MACSVGWNYAWAPRVRRAKRTVPGFPALAALSEGGIMHVLIWLLSGVVMGGLAVPAGSHPRLWPHRGSPSRHPGSPGRRLGLPAARGHDAGQHRRPRDEFVLGALLVIGASRLLRPVAMADVPGRSPKRAQASISKPASGSSARSIGRRSTDSSRRDQPLRLATPTSPSTSSSPSGSGPPTGLRPSVAAGTSSASSCSS